MSTTDEGERVTQVPGATRRAYGNRRTQVIESATAVFADHGYEGATLRQIADHAGLAKGHISYYFSTKEDLLFAITERLHDEFVRLADDHQNSTNGDAGTLAELLRGHVLLVCRQIDETWVSYENFRYLSKDRHRQIVAKRDHYEGYLRSLVAEYVAEDESARVVELATRGVLGLVNWPYQWFRDGGAATPLELADVSVRMALGSLEALREGRGES